MSSSLSFFETPEGVWQSTYDSAVATSSPIAASEPAKDDASPAIPLLTPPQHASKLSLVYVDHPTVASSNGAAGLGLGNLVGLQRSNTGNLQKNGSNGGPATGNSSSASSGITSSPVTVSPVKRKAFTIPKLGSLTNGNAESSSSLSSSRPMRTFRGTSSSFVRTWEGLPVPTYKLKEMASVPEALYAFYTTHRSVAWCEVGVNRPKEAICRISFSESPTCVDTNQSTASPDRLDVIVGFDGCDIFWFDPYLARYSRFNKAGVICNSAVTAVRWLHAGEGHNTLFVSSHANGAMVIWDKDKEDAPFVPPPVIRHLSISNPKLNGAAVDSHAPTTSIEAAGMSDITVTRLPTVDRKGMPTKSNPVSYWNISKRAILDFAFSPDEAYCASVGEDGCLRIVETATETLLDTFAGYFGFLSSVAWSPDGRFVITGGQDDLTSIYAPHERRLVARCQGHASFVTGLSFDPWRSDERTTRFASVGEDCRLIVWELSSAALSRPKAHGPYNHRHTQSSFSLVRRRPGEESLTHLPLNSDDEAYDSTPIFHPSPRRSQVSLLQPVMTKTLSNELFSQVRFLAKSCITLTRTGTIEMYNVN